MTDNKPKVKYILEYSVFNEDENSHLVKDLLVGLKAKTIVEKCAALENSPCDIFSLKFNIETSAEIDEAVKLLKKLLKQIKKPLMIRGCGNNNLDLKLIPKLVKTLDRCAIVAYANENTYQKIIPSVLKGKHTLVIRTPIDINLAKEMNILSTDLGLCAKKIIMDTDMGGLGYGLEYGYSIIERIKSAAKSDPMLDMPIIAFAGEESLKTKEAKSDTFDKSWGDFKRRSAMFEIATAAAIKAAGADYIVLNCPSSIKTLKEVK